MLEYESQHKCPINDPNVDKYHKYTIHGSYGRVDIVVAPISQSMGVILYTFPTDRDGRPNPCKSPADTRHSEHRPERAKKRNKAGWWLLFLSIPKTMKVCFEMGYLYENFCESHIGKHHILVSSFNPHLILILEPQKNIIPF